MEKEIEYVQAELWSGEYAEISQNKDGVTTKNNRNILDNTTERSQRQSSFKYFLIFGTFSWIHLGSISS